MFNTTPHYHLMRVKGKLFTSPPSSRLTVRQPTALVGVTPLRVMASTTAAQPLPTKGCAKPLINLLRGTHTVRLPETATKLIALFCKAGRMHPSFLQSFYEPQQITSCQIALSLFQASNTARTGATSFCVNLSQNGWMSSILRLNPLMWGESQSLEAPVRIWRVYCRHSRIQDIQEIYGS